MVFDFLLFLDENEVTPLLLLLCLWQIFFSPKKARNNVDQTDFMLLPKDHQLLTRTTWKPSHTHNQNQASTIFWKCQCLADKRIFRLDKNLIGNNLLDLHSQNRNTTTIYWLVSTSFNKRWWLLTRYWHTYKLYFD